MKRKESMKFYDVQLIGMKDRVIIPKNMKSNEHEAVFDGKIRRVFDFKEIDCPVSAQDGLDKHYYVRDWNKDNVLTIRRKGFKDEQYEYSIQHKDLFDEYPIVEDVGSSIEDKGGWKTINGNKALVFDEEQINEIFNIWEKSETTKDRVDALGYGVVKSITLGQSNAAPTWDSISINGTVYQLGEDEEKAKATTEQLLEIQDEHKETIDDCVANIIEYRSQIESLEAAIADEEQLMYDAEELLSEIEGVQIKTRVL